MEFDAFAFAALHQRPDDASMDIAATADDVYNGNGADEDCDDDINDSDDDWKRKRRGRIARQRQHSRAVTEEDDESGAFSSASNASSSASSPSSSISAPSPSSSSSSSSSSYATAVSSWGLGRSADATPSQRDAATAVSVGDGNRNGNGGAVDSNPDPPAAMAAARAGGGSRKRECGDFDDRRRRHRRHRDEYNDRLLRRCLRGDDDDDDDDDNNKGEDDQGKSIGGGGSRSTANPIGGGGRCGVGRGESHRRLAVALNNVAALRHELGNYTGALRLYQESIRARMEALRSSSSSSSTSLPSFAAEGADRTGVDDAASPTAAAAATDDAAAFSYSSSPSYAQPSSSTTSSSSTSAHNSIIESRLREARMEERALRKALSLLTITNPTTTTTVQLRMGLATTRRRQQQQQQKQQRCRLYHENDRDERRRRDSSSSCSSSWASSSCLDMFPRGNGSRIDRLDQRFLPPAPPVEIAINSAAAATAAAADFSFETRAESSFHSSLFSAGDARDSCITLYNMGLSHLRSHSLPKAIQLFEMALSVAERVEPPSPSSLSPSSSTYESYGYSESSSSSFSTGACFMGPRILNAMAIAKVGMGNLAGASAVLARALRLWREVAAAMSSSSYSGSPCSSHSPLSPSTAATTTSYSSYSYHRPSPSYSASLYSPHSTSTSPYSHATPLSSRAFSQHRRHDDDEISAIDEDDDKDGDEESSLDLGVAETLSLLSRVHFLAGNRDRSLDLIFHCLDLRRTVLGERHVSVASTYYSIGIVLGDMGRSADAVRYVRYFVAHPDVVGCTRYRVHLAEATGALGSMYLDASETTSAVDALGRCVALRSAEAEMMDEAASAASAAALASAQASLSSSDASASCEYHQSSHSDDDYCCDAAAFAAAQAAITSRAKVASASAKSALADDFIRLGRVLHDLGCFREALIRYRSAFDIESSLARNIGGGGGQGGGDVRGEREDDDDKEEDDDEERMEEEVQSSPSLSRPVLRAGESEGVATALCSIGQVHQALGDYDRALSCYADVLRISRALFGEDDVFVASMLSVVGNVCLEMGDTEGAVRNFAAAERIWRHVHWGGEGGGSEHLRREEGMITELDMNVETAMGGGEGGGSETGGERQSAATIGNGLEGWSVGGNGAASTASGQTRRDQHGQVGPIVVIPNLFQVLGINFYPHAAAA